MDAFTAATTTQVPVPVDAETGRVYPMYTCVIAQGPASIDAETGPVPVDAETGRVYPMYTCVIA
jgi:hypothetical protein